LGRRPLHGGPDQQVVVSHAPMVARVRRQVGGRTSAAGTPSTVNGRANRASWSPTALAASTYRPSTRSRAVIPGSSGSTSQRDSTPHSSYFDRLSTWSLRRVEGVWTSTRSEE